MIIVSQDKKEIINFDKIKNIKLDPVLDCRNIIVNLDGVYTDIGGYKTKEKAKEVLQEIILAYKYTQQKYCTIGDLKKLIGEFDNNVYEMPLE